MSLYDVLVMMGFRSLEAGAISTLLAPERRVEIEKQCNENRSLRRTYTDDQYEVITLSRRLGG